MKKLALLTATLLASASILADVSVQVTLKNNDQEFVSDAIVLTSQNPSAVFTLNEQPFKVVLVQEDPCVLNIFENDELVMAPEFSEALGTISVSNEDTHTAITVAVTAV